MRFFNKQKNIIATILLLMALFPPVSICSVYGGTNGYGGTINDFSVQGSCSFRGYEFVFSMRKNRSIDTGRLAIQLIALGSAYILLGSFIEFRRRKLAELKDGQNGES